MNERLKNIIWQLAPALLAVVIAHGMASRVFRHTPLTTDEQSYIFQANTFRDGRLTRDYPPFPHLLGDQMIIMEEEAGWVSRYPPGHALFLLPGAWLGDHYLSAALGAGLALWLAAMAAAQAARLGAAAAQTAGRIAACMLLASPWFLFTFGTLLSHTSGFLAVSAMLAAYLWWRQSERPAAAFLAGLAWGFLCLNRTYSALLIALPFGLDALWTLARRPNRRVLAGALLFAGSAAAGIAALLLYNELILGHPLKMTYLYYEPLEALGFGKRHYGMHTFAKGLKILKNNLLLADAWLWGFPGGLLVWAGLLLMGRPRRQWLALAGPVIAVPAGYVFFFHRGPHETGPGYYFEMLPFLIAGAAPGAARLWRLAAAWTPARRRWAALVLALALLAGPLRFSMQAARGLHDLLAPRREILQAIAAAPPDALVFVEDRGWHGDHPMDFAIVNPRGLQSAPLVMAAADGTEIAAARFFSGRRPFRLAGGSPPGLTPLNSSAPYAVAINPARAHRRTGSNFQAEAGAPVERLARAGRDAAGMLLFGNYRYICPGRFQALFEMETAGDAGAEAAVLDICADGGRRTLAECSVPAGFQGTQAVAFAADGYFMIEPRAYYTGRGEVRIKSIRLVEQTP